jgi:hypothetical protein
MPRLPSYINAPFVVQLFIGGETPLGKGYRRSYSEVKKTVFLKILS